MQVYWSIGALKNYVSLIIMTASIKASNYGCGIIIISILLVETRSMCVTVDSTGG